MINKFKKLAENCEKFDTVLHQLIKNTYYLEQELHDNIEPELVIPTFIMHFPRLDPHFAWITLGGPKFSIDEFLTFEKCTGIIHQRRCGKLVEERCASTLQAV